MKQVSSINPHYKESEALKNFMHGLPRNFELGGTMLWNGRNKIKAFPIENGEEIVVKRFKRLRPLQKLIYSVRRHKARKAYENGIELTRRGFDTPTPIAFMEIWSDKLLKDAYYICGRNDNPPIEELTYRDDWNKELAIAFAQFAACLHMAGVLHHDLNDTNVRYSIKDDQYAFSLIDINRMTFYDSIDDIPMKERIENLTRFTGRIDLFEFVAREYARACGLDVEEWTNTAVEQKRRHDRNWYRRKRLLHPFRKR